MATDPRSPSAVRRAGAAEVTADDFSALLAKEFKPRSDEAKTRVELAVRTLAEQALAGSNVMPGDVIGTIESMIASLDRTLTTQVNTIIHHPEFQALESAWRGLQYTVFNTETSTDLKIKVMNVSKDELRKMFGSYRGASWDQSPLFKRVYEQEFGQLGGQPTGVSSATIISVRARPTSRSSRAWQRCRARATRRSSRVPHRRCSAWTAGRT